MRQLKNTFRLGNVSQPMSPEIDERRAIGQRPTNNSRSHTGDQDLPAVPDRANARSAVDMRAAIIRAGFASVNCYADPQRYFFRPFLAPER